MFDYMIQELVPLETIRSEAFLTLVGGPYNRKVDPLTKDQIVNMVDTSYKVCVTSVSFAGHMYIIHSCCSHLRQPNLYNVVGL